MNVSVVNSAEGSFCSNYATDIFYHTGDACCSYAGFGVLLQLRRWYFVTVMLVDFSVAITQVTVSVAIMHLEVSAALMQVKVSAANMWVIIFIVIMQLGVSNAIMQVVLSAVHYAHDCFNCNYAVNRSCYSYVGDSFKEKFYNLSIADHQFFKKIDRKTFKGIISDLHFTTFVDILPKLRYFKGRNHIQIS